MIIKRYGLGPHVRIAYLFYKLVLNANVYMWYLYNSRAKGAKRRSGRKPGARVTNFVLAELKVFARDR